jgi:hypothetical protein
MHSRNEAVYQYAAYALYEAAVLDYVTHNQCSVKLRSSSVCVCVWGGGGALHVQLCSVHFGSFQVSI